MSDVPVTFAAAAVPDIWPVTVVRARYGGSYEPGQWLAFPLHPFELPGDWDASDVPCAEFWGSYAEPVGAGDTPDRALTDLGRKVPGRRTGSWTNWP